MAADGTSTRTAFLVCALLVGATVLGLAGTDLVLPAIPGLPAALAGTPAQAQLVLAAFAGGTALGLVAFGELGARFDPRRLLAGSLAVYGAVSLLAVLVPDLAALVLLRIVQGFAGSAAVVFAPGMVRCLFDDAGAMRALGVLGSIEALVPALAPLLGIWLLTIGDWRAAFVVVGLPALGLALLVAVRPALLPEPPRPAARRGYGVLLRDAVFLRYALSQACTLGALLIFVFGAPAVIVGALDGTLEQFIVMQVSGITTYIVAANLAGRIAGRFGAERTILAGSLLSLGGALALCAHALHGAPDASLWPVLFVPMNAGLGLRGPPGFLRAIVAGRGEDARAAALVMLAVLGVAAAGTAAVAPLITLGAVPLTLVTAAVSATGIVLLLVLPPLEEDAPEAAR